MCVFEIDAKNKTCIMSYLFSWSYDIFPSPFQELNFYNELMVPIPFSELFLISLIFWSSLIFIIILYNCYYFTDSYLDLNRSR